MALAGRTGRCATRDQRQEVGQEAPAVQTDGARGVPSFGVSALRQTREAARAGFPHPAHMSEMLFPPTAH